LRAFSFPVFFIRMAVRVRLRRDSSRLVPMAKTKLIPLPRGARWKFFFCFLLTAILIFAAMVWTLCPTNFHWPDRRPIGVLFLASGYHASATNPRGWFNDDKLDVVGAGGQERFKQVLFDYADRSIVILKKTGAQGVIVWDVEGEQYPHKTTFIGDPRLLGSLAPEMAPLADEFFKRFRDAGFKVGVVIRPQELVFENGIPRQMAVLDMKRILLEKVDYARTNWGATIFYLDSDYSVLRPDEVWQLRRLEEQRPDILLIPEHHYLPYAAFSAPYISLRKGKPGATERLARKLYPGSFDALDISDASADEVAAVWHEGDVLLFRTWYWNSDCDIVQQFQHGRP
jgi:hypothetical protein